MKFPCFQTMTFACFAVSILIASPALAQDETFKLYNPDVEIPVGTTFDVTISTKLDKAKLTMNAAGIKVDGTMSVSVDEKFAMRVLGKNKIVSVIKASKINTSLQMAGENNNEDIANPLLDKKIMIEKIDGKWRVSLLKGEANAKEKELLDAMQEEAERLEKNDAITYGDKDYKVGDVVRIRVPLYSMFGLADEVVSESANLKIERVEELDGVRCAVLKGQLSARSKMEPDESIQEGSSVINGDLTVWRSIDYSMDMKVEYEGKLDQSMRLEGGAAVMNGRGGPVKASHTVKVRK